MTTSIRTITAQSIPLVLTVFAGALGSATFEHFAHPGQSPHSNSQDSRTTSVGAAEVSDRDYQTRLADTERTRELYHQQLLEKFAAEAVDSAWAPTATERIGVALRSSATRGSFSIDSVECKKTMCIAALNWTSYPAAQKDLRVASQQGVPCATELRLPPPADPERPYSATLVLECGQMRADAM